MKISTHENQSFSRSKFMDSEVVYDENLGKNVEIMNFVNYNLVGLIKNLQNYKIIQYKGEPITTISYREYETTSLWWLILLVNGLRFPSEMVQGQDLIIPSYSQINSYFKSSNNTSRSGQRASV
jgi:hypothetical protein